MAAWMGLAGGVAVEPRGDLAAPLAAAVATGAGDPSPRPEIELRTSPRSCGPKCAVRLAGVTARRWLSAWVVDRTWSAAVVASLRTFSLASWASPWTCSFATWASPCTCWAATWASSRTVVAASWAAGLRCSAAPWAMDFASVRASSSTGRTCWSTRWCSFCVAGRRLDTSIPAPRAMSPAASGLPSVAEVAADGAPVTLSTAVEATSAALSLAVPAVSAIELPALEVRSLTAAGVVGGPHHPIAQALEGLPHPARGGARPCARAHPVTDGLEVVSGTLPLEVGLQCI